MNETLGERQNKKYRICGLNDQLFYLSLISRVGNY